MKKHECAGKLRLLLIAYFDPNGLGTIVEGIDNIQYQSRHTFEILNLFVRSRTPDTMPKEYNLRSYDGILIHSTVAYNVASLERLDRFIPVKIKDYNGIKIVMKQDEHFRINRFISWAAASGINGLLTCFTPKIASQVYSQEALPTVKFMHTLTGYVTSKMRESSNLHKGVRDIDIGYRGSLQPLSFGRLCYEKQEIGDRFIHICHARNLVYDISSQWEDRFFGDDWYQFLGRCKATLGVESGASVFDFSGDIETTCAAILKEQPTIGFEALHQMVLAPHEGKIYYNQISPRHFEAAATRTLQIMYTGHYSGIFQPWQHYLPLQRDLSNLDDVLERFKDLSFRQEIVDRAYEEIIANDVYAVKTFIDRLDDFVESLYPSQ